MLKSASERGKNVANTRPKSIVKKENTHAPAKIFVEGTVGYTRSLHAILLQKFKMILFIFLTN